MDENTECLEGHEFIFKYGRLHLLPLDRIHEDENGNTVATEQKAYRRERVVRCRDCKHAIEGRDAGTLDCMHFAQWDYYDDEPGHWPVEPDGFCAWGEERG